MVASSTHLTPLISNFQLQLLWQMCDFTKEINTALSIWYTVTDLTNVFFSKTNQERGLEAYTDLE